MASNRIISNAVRLTLLTAAMTATGAVAQETELEQIVVTGSRIASTGLDSPSPLQIIGAQEIDQTGVVNIQNLLLSQPQFGTPGVSRTNSNFSTSSAGVATVDLRNLGTSRTLVLVNGRRFVAGIPGESAVDLNTIPTQFIERVDVLTGGASAVYGSDAVAGVVNIIYKQDFEGVEFDYQYGATNQGDNVQHQAGMTMGTNIADGKGNIVAYLGYTDEGAVFTRDRSRSKIDQYGYASYYGYSPNTKNFFNPSFRPFRSSYAPAGRFYRPDDGNPLTPRSSYSYATAAGPTTPSTCFSTNTTDPNTACVTGFNRSEYRTIAIPTERYLAALNGKYEIVDGHSAFLEVTYANTQATTELEPFPLDADDIYPDSGGITPLEFEYNGQLLRNPLVPNYTYNIAVDEDGDGRKDLFSWRKRLADIGNRGSVADRDTFRFAAGFEGEFEVLSTSWNYDTYYSWGKTGESQVSGGQVNVLNFRNALEAIPDVDDIDGDGNVAEAICRDADARDQGCVPINIYGPGSITPEMAKYVTAPSLLSTYTSQQLAGLNVSGEPIELWAGPLGLAFGVEYRAEYSRSEFDALQQAGLNAGNAIPATEGRFDVLEGYIETVIPLLDDVFLAHQLDLRGAIRFSDYSTVGATESWNAGLEWAPIPQVRFRAINAQSTRAPNINELYSPPSQDFPTGLNDPCIGVTLTSVGTVDDNCRADPGVLQNILTSASGAFTLNQADRQGISGFNTGNPDLKEETGKSWTVGMVITPENIAVLEDMSFTVDWFDIDIEDAIVPLPRQYTLDQCYGQGNPAACGLITRRADVVGGNSAGSIEFLDQPTANTGGLGSSGIDFTVTYGNEIGPGTFNGKITYTYLIDGYTKPTPGAAKDPFAGEIGAAESRAYATLGYNIGDFGIAWNITYIGESYLDDQFLVGIANELDADGDPVSYWKPESVSVDAIVYHDVQVTWSPGEMVELYVGANNLFDEAPPPIITGLPGNITGAETDSGTYDAIGQRFYGGFRVKF